jgi:hypothetical protein
MFLFSAASILPSIACVGFSYRFFAFFEALILGGHILDIKFKIAFRIASSAKLPSASLS